MFIHEHFIERLKERYNISITVEEYYELCKAPYEVIGVKVNREGKKCLATTMNIKGKEVYVLRNIPHRSNKYSEVMLTAMPYGDSSKLPPLDVSNFNVREMIVALRKRKDRIRELHNALYKCRGILLAIGDNIVEGNLPSLDLVYDSIKSIDAIIIKKSKQNRDGETTGTEPNQ